MQNQLIETYNKMAQESFDAMRKLSEINMRTGEHLFKHQLDLGNAWVETGVKGVELMGKAKGYQEMMSGQTKLAQEYAQKCLDTYRTAAEVLTGAREEISKVLDEQTKLAGTNMQAASETFQKAAEKATS
ncbi:phasin family protein [Thiorhodospira sibirica]|uniref:phasin family protein n=1 Tax=Thiorhodospira sibirica TaxID=154347 RepID=UPI00022C5E34|nr:phasin family protein [Thiorhodospira sibirica]